MVSHLLPVSLDSKVDATPTGPCHSSCCTSHQWRSRRRQVAGAVPATARPTYLRTAPVARLLASIAALIPESKLEKWSSGASSRWKKRNPDHAGPSGRKLPANAQCLGEFWQSGRSEAIRKPSRPVMVVLACFATRSPASSPRQRERGAVAGVVLRSGGRRGWHYWESRRPSLRRADSGVPCATGGRRVIMANYPMAAFPVRQIRQETVGRFPGTVGND